MKKIEYACTGNNGRSPLSRAISKAYLIRLGETQYDTISSGTAVDNILAGEMPMPLKKKVLVNGVTTELEGKIYTPENVGEAVRLAKQVESMSNEEFESRYQSDNAFREQFETYAENSRKYFANEENTHAIQVAKEMGIDYLLDGNFKQTKIESDTVAFMAMAQGNLDAAKKIYDGQDPQIMCVISQYVNGTQAEDVPNTFGQPVEAYHKMIKILEPLVKEATEKVISIYR